MSQQHKLPYKKIFFTACYFYFYYICIPSEEPIFNLFTFKLSQLSTLYEPIN